MKLPNRGLLCVVESDTKRALQPKWYPIKSLLKNGKITSQAQNNTQKSKQFFFFQTWQLALCKSWLYPLVFQSMGRIGTLTSSRVALNQRDIYFQYEIKLTNKQIGHPLFFLNLGHRAPTMAEPTLLLWKKKSSIFSVEGPRWEPTNPYWNCPAMSKFYGFQRLGNHQQEKNYVFFLVQWWSWTNADLFGNMFGKGLDFYSLLFKFWMNSRSAKGCWVATFLSTKRNCNFFAHRKAAWPCTKVR